ncbi:MAG: sugar phosphate nucleotidyltransferase [Vicinamibacterales bacterium]|nr:sugar phosphate nucleotidyltransferase [Vicinamibacterales bacterium]
MPESKSGVSGVILAAGKGARMYPFSDKTPKPILPILNRPLLVHQIETMRDSGITSLHIVVGHLGYQVASVLGDGERFGVRITFHEQESTLGLAHAVGALEPHLPGPFLLMLGDIFFQLSSPLQPIIDDVVSRRANASLVSMYEPDPAMVRRNFVIQADDDRVVHRVIEKPRYVDSQLKGCGLYVFDPHIFDAIRRTPRTAMRDEYEITDSIQILIDDGYRVRHWPIVERDLNLTKAEDLLAINLLELSRQGLDHLIGDDVEMPPGTVIERSVIGAGVVIQHPIRITNAVILPGVVVESAADLDSVVLNGEHLVYCPGVAAGPAS